MKGIMFNTKYGLEQAVLNETKTRTWRADKEPRYKIGEPADLILVEWQPIYKALGRDGLFEYLETQSFDLKDAKKYVKQLKSKEK